jgi:N6-adenosine-specific RNA methylase IME4
MPEVEISSIVVNGRHRKDLGDIEALARSIQDIGLLQPVVLASDGTTLVAGERRIAAYRQLGRTRIPAHIVTSIDDLYGRLRGERDENTCRKDFDPSEGVAMGRSVTEAAKAMAKAAHQEGVKRGGETAGKGRPKDNSSGANCTTPKRDNSKRTKAKEAQAAGMKQRTYEKAEAVVDSGDEELIAEMDRTGKVDRAFRKLRVATAIHEPAKLPEGVFDVLLADPPWKYDFAETETREIENQYPTMTVSELAKLSVPSATDSVLFLWATAPKLREALAVLDAWGFDYKTHAIWDKEKIGMGYWFRGQHELLLVGTKGKFKAPPEGSRVSSVIRSARSKHSEKPDAAYVAIEQMFPHGRRLELFARTERQGWERWGNQA